MKQFSINTNRTIGKGRTEKAMIVETQLQQTTGRFPLPNYSKVLDQRALYEKERNSCTRLRLMLTIAPYCTNILFNPLTEIFHRDANGGYSVVTDGKKESKQITADVKYTGQNARGKITPTREEMVQNTEYSNSLIGYEYHPGMDIFDNHIFRNKTFKLVNNWNEESDRDVYNTIQDYMRDSRGQSVPLIKRETNTAGNESQIKTEKKRHLYLRDDLMSISDSMNANISEENGWWGFVNPNKLETKYFAQQKWNDLYNSKVMNSNKGCEFIDMYPDRSLFSFNPKYNPYTHKPEYNWNVVVTYPYENDYEHELCCGKGDLYRLAKQGRGYVEEKANVGKVWTSLKIYKVFIGNNVSGNPQVYFRTYTKHGVRRNDFIYLYYTIKGKDGRFYESTRMYKVSGVGDEKKQNQDYYFYINDKALFEELTMEEMTMSYYYADSYRVVYPFKDYLINDRIDPHTYANELSPEQKTFCEPEGRKNIRVCPWIDNVSDETDYFYGLRDNGVETLTYLGVTEESLYDNYGRLDTDRVEQAIEGREFRFCRVAGETRSIYYLRKFMRVPNLKAANKKLGEEDVKDNASLMEYIDGNCLMDGKMRVFAKEQYQLAFARSIYNDAITQMIFTDSIDIDVLKDNLGRPLTSLYYTVVKNNKGHEQWYGEEPSYVQSDIEYSHCFGVVSSGLDLHIEEEDAFSATEVEEWQKLSSIWHIRNVKGGDGTEPKIIADRERHALDYDINYLNETFYGDLCEFNAAEYIEYVLSDVKHRFNTAQRETVKNPHYSSYNFHEIVSDDLDKDGFQVKCYSVVNGEMPNEEGGVKDGHDEEKDYKSITRPEGYVYKAHYEIPVREWGYLTSGGHDIMEVSETKPVQDGGVIYIEVTTYLPHHLGKGDKVYVCDETNNVWCVTQCAEVLSNIRFRFVPKYTSYLENHTDFEDKEEIMNEAQDVYIEERGLYNDWLKLCEIFNESGVVENAPKLLLRRENKDIPEHAIYGGENTYNWRELQNVGDIRNKKVKDHVFANGHFYVPTHMNFFMERQDRFGNTGNSNIGSDSPFPNDITPLLKHYQAENNEEEPRKEC